MMMCSPDLRFHLTRWRLISSCGRLITVGPLPTGESAPDSMVRVSKDRQLSLVGTYFARVILI
jgi:hypothetical protein